MDLGRIAIIGGGRMGQKLCAGLLSYCGIDPADICVANPGEAKRLAIEEAYGVQTVACAAEALPAQTIILAVRPADVATVCEELAEAGLPADALVISVAAGVSTESIAQALGARNPQALGARNPIVRVMPNAPLAYGAGVAGISAATGCPQEKLDAACEMFELMGGGVVVPEDQQDIVTAVSGSGPAYFELVIAAIASGAEKLGMNHDAALKLALQTMYGTAVMLKETGQDPLDALDVICTKGGTTEAAIASMRAAGLEEALEGGIASATHRSRELGKR